MALPLSLLMYCADSSVMRVDKSSLPHQSIMEILIEPLEPKEKIRSESFPSIKNWWFVKVKPPGKVTHINFSGKALTGSLQLEWLPDTVQKFDTGFNKMSGTLNLECLPESLKE